MAKMGKAIENQAKAAQIETLEKENLSPNVDILGKGIEVDLEMVPFSANGPPKVNDPLLNHVPNGSSDPFSLPFSILRAKLTPLVGTIGMCSSRISKISVNFINKFSN